MKDIYEIKGIEANKIIGGVIGGVILTLVGAMCLIFNTNADTIFFLIEVFILLLGLLSVFATLRLTSNYIALQENCIIGKVYLPNAMSKLEFELEYKKITDVYKTKQGIWETITILSPSGKYDIIVKNGEQVLKSIKKNLSLS